MQIKRYSDDGNWSRGGLCSGRRTTRMDWESGDWAEITRYVYETGVVISVVGTLFPEDHDPYSWGRLHFFRSENAPSW
jgi:hypothetical protein